MPSVIVTKSTTCENCNTPDELEQGFECSVCGTQFCALCFKLVERHPGRHIGCPNPNCKAELLLPDPAFL